MVLNKVKLAALSVIAILVAGALVTAAAIASPALTTESQREQKPRPVRAVRTRLEPVERTIRSFGSLSAHEQATLSTKVAGRLENMAVDLGAIVPKGELIAQIDQRDYRLAGATD